MGSVSATGEYQYRIPIDVPQGRAGVQPSLALVYGSRGGNGHLGVGWQLQGLSEINRCAKTFATEGYADGVNFDADDVFCLDGHKLIAVSGSYGADGTEYR
ncbi:MAG: SpvB/TcaC N-terminal domain-containing protein, partial [Byssovorax sp.]